VQRGELGTRGRPRARVLDSRTYRREVKALNGPNLAFVAKRWLARLWGGFPSEGLKTAVVWAMGPRFLVSVLAVVFDRDGRILLLRHTHDAPHPWGLPSGRLETSETPVRAASRELAEETGLEVQVQALVALEREFPLPVLRAAYLCRVVGGVFRPSVEVTDVRYFALDELPASVRPLQRHIIKQAQEMREQRCES
jgi:ADP-ribose pyrophosphatase YjhB (NUDIX family)